MSGNWYSFVGGNPGDQAGLVTSTGDYNADGITDYLIGAEGAAGEDGRIYLVSGTDLAAADAADGTDDNVIDLANVAAQPDSLVFTAPFAGGQLGVGLSRSTPMETGSTICGWARALPMSIRGPASSGPVPAIWSTTTIWPTGAPPTPAPTPSICRS
jgi:hypothetical protein